MHFVCISASNIKHARERSTSTLACQVVVEILRDLSEDKVISDIIPLVDYELKPCTGCGHCFETGRCVQDITFNHLYERIISAKGLFIIAAHYAPIPAKLCMLLEKIEQLAFLPRFDDEENHSPLYKIPVGIIGHCGGTEELIRRGYKGQILDTIANALSWPVEMKILAAGEEWPNGVIFPVKQVSKSPDSRFPIQEYDWQDIRSRLTPLVAAVFQTVYEGESGKDN